jgi:uncharacterized protein (DUF2252 family)
LKNKSPKTKGRSSLEYDFPRLAKAVGEQLSVQDNPPTIYHLENNEQLEFNAAVREGFARYRETLSEDRRVLLDRFEFKDIAVKVVGIGSVGTACAVILMMAGERDPLFLQLKEARASVLEPYAGKSVYSNHGQRVVMGYHLMQSASDMFLG